MDFRQKPLVTSNRFTCITQLNQDKVVDLVLAWPLIAGRIVIGLYGEVVPKTVGILILLVLFCLVHLLPLNICVPLSSVFLLCFLACLSKEKFS